VSFTVRVVERRPKQREFGKKNLFQKKLSGQLFKKNTKIKLTKIQIIEIQTMKFKVKQRKKNNDLTQIHYFFCLTKIKMWECDFFSTGVDISH